MLHCKKCIERWGAQDTWGWGGCGHKLVINIESAQASFSISYQIRAENMTKTLENVQAMVTF